MFYQRRKQLFAETSVWRQLHVSTDVRQCANVVYWAEARHMFHFHTDGEGSPR